MKNLFGEPNLFSRLVKVMLLLTLTTVTLFTFATLFIAYSFEDVLFDERLKQAHLKLAAGESLPYDLKLIDTTVDIDQGLLERIRFFEMPGTKNLGELRLNGRHYHFLKTNFGTILYDTTDVTIVNRALEDIFIILGVLLIPVLFLTYWVARYSARYALKPFSQLCEVFTQSEQQTMINTDHLEDVREVDVKTLAYKLHDALDKKAETLERQTLLNQGIAHELRTPLQVMEHSIELLSYSHQAVCETASYVRLKKSARRMTRLCNGLLWLTSDRAYYTKLRTGACIQGLLEELNDVSKAHHVKIELEIIEELTFTMPKEVFELILFNLLNNVVLHGVKDGKFIVFRIQVNEKQVTFSNDANPDNKESADESNFGVGLMLVTKLAERFFVRTEYKNDCAQFSVALFPR